MRRIWQYATLCVVSVLAISLIGAGACCLVFGDRVTDATYLIRENLEQDYVLTRAMFIARDDGKERLITGVHYTTPLSLDRYRTNPEEFPRLIAGLPAGTVFRIRDCVRIKEFAVRRVFDLHVEIMSGPYKGRILVMSEIEIMRIGENDTMRFLPFVEPAKGNRESGTVFHAPSEFRGDAPGIPGTPF